MSKRKLDPLREAVLDTAGRHLAEVRRTMSPAEQEHFDDHMMIVMEMCWLNGAMSTEPTKEADYAFIMGTDVLPEDIKAMVELRMEHKNSAGGGCN